MKGIVEYVDEDVVSSDFVSDNIHLYLTAKSRNWFNRYIC